MDENVRMGEPKCEGRTQIHITLLCNLQGTHLGGKSDESKTTAPIGDSVNNNHRIDHLSKLLEELEELLVRYCKK